MENNKDLRLLCEGLNESAQVIFENNKEKGFWDEKRNIGELLMLVVTELSEALDAHQKGRFSSEIDENPISPELFKETVKDTFEDEIADAVIRLLDLSAGLGINLEAHIRAKVAYNKTRERLHGKAY